MINKIMNWKPKLKLSVRGHLNQVLVSMQQNGELSVMSWKQVDPRTSVGDERDIALDAATSSEGAHGYDLELEFPLFEEEVDGNCI